MVATRFTFPLPVLVLVLLSSLIIEHSTTANAQKGSETKAIANTNEVHEDDVVVQVHETSAARSKLLRGRKLAVTHETKTKAKNSGQTRKPSRKAFEKANKSINKSKELGSNVNGASESHRRSQPFRTHKIQDAEAAKVVSMISKDYSHASRSRRPIHNHKLLEDNDD